MPQKIVPKRNPVRTDPTSTRRKVNLDGSVEVDLAPNRRSRRRSDKEAREAQARERARHREVRKGVAE